MISYVVINKQTYPANDLSEIWLIESILKEEEIDFVYIWEAPYATQREAENHKYAHVRRTSRKIYK